MASVLSGFLLVLWKNMVVRRRHWLLTLFEVAVPLLLFVSYALAKGLAMQSPGMELPSDAVYFARDDLAPGHMVRTARLLYAPNTSFAHALMQRVQDSLHTKGVEAFDSEAALLERYQRARPESVFGVVFEGSELHLKYKVRSSHDFWQTERLFPVVSFPGPMGSSDMYFSTGFISLQRALDAAFMSHVSNSSNMFEVTTQQFPYPAFNMRASTGGEMNGILLPLLTVLGFVMLCPGLLKRVVEEKESGIRELMKMTGLRGWMLWLGWLVNALLVNLVSVTVIVVLASWSVLSPGSRLLDQADPTLLWVFLALYCVSSGLLCLAFSTLFSRPTLATSCGVMAWLLSYFVPMGMVEARGRVGLGVKLLTALLPNMAVSWGFKTITTFETRGVGASWANVWEVPSGSQEDLSMLHVLLCQVASCVLFSLLTWYVDAIMPGNYGIARPWYFPVAWLAGRGGRVCSHADCEAGAAGADARANVEPAPADRKVGVEVRGLRKVFTSCFHQTKKVAVDGVSLDIYAGCITALLGHNGAGKTTLISVLTGLFSPSSGSVFVDGHSVVRDLGRVRASLGLCPQHNLLFPDLTVMEHLLFFGQLKGQSRAAARREAQALLSRLNIADKAHKLTHTLSGGMKRKLSLGIALIGDSKVLILDEPTSGMDPEARREMWDLLLSMRGQRTILLTTHFMEEADVLGDRIAIMDHGRLRCYGTSLYLKKLYGTGYRLKLAREGGCKESAVAALVKDSVPDAEQTHDDPSKLSFALPAEQTAHFPALFDALEARKSELGVGSISLSVTTMEEVFLRVGQEADDDKDKDKDTDRGSCRDSEEDRNSSKCLTYQKLTGLQLLAQQARALLVKKMLFTYRRWFLFLMKSLVPLALAALTISLSTRTPIETLEEPPLQLALAGYRAREVPFAVGAGPDVPWARLAEAYGRLAGGEPLAPGASVSSHLLALGEENVVHFREQLVAAAEFNATGRGTVAANALYSSVLLHAAPVSLNLLDNALLHFLANESLSITAVNHPFPSQRLVQASGSGAMVMFLWLSLMSLGPLVLAGAFLVFPLDERVSQVKQLQLMADVRAPLYWLVCFAWDYLLYLGVAVALLIVVCAFDQQRVFSGTAELGVLFLILALYGLSNIPCAYFFSYLKKTVASGFVVFVVTNLLIGVLVCTVLFVLDNGPNETLRKVATGLRYSLMLLPHFSLCHALMHFSWQVVENHACELQGEALTAITCEHSPTDLCCPNGPAAKVLPYLAWPSEDNSRAVGVEVLYLSLSWLLYGALILLVDHGVAGRLYERLLCAVFSRAHGRALVDADVLKEQERVDGSVRDGHENGRLRSVHHGSFYQMLCPSIKDPKSDKCYWPDVSTKLCSMPARADGASDDVLVVHGLEKRYGGRFAAVKGISFGVGRGSCFGLLGVNGAGKTTTFQMLTGAQVATRGDAYIDACSLRHHPDKFLSQLGYCPQFDALNTSLTGREMLQLFASLRGVPRRDMDHEVSYWICRLGLGEHADALCGTYSGGNKRKLSTALALVGGPPVVLLDEPTSGVDPVARRNLWGVLREAQDRDQAVVLTSHSMDECEALCRRLAIMVNGQFVCMGDIQYLKGKFGQGFTVLLKLRSGAAEPLVCAVKRDLEAAFPGRCMLKDEHQGMLHYHVTDPHVPWQRLFSVLESLKGCHPLVQDYTVSETTLEQVFLAFARAEKDVPAA
ncbi:phospholipid-transporting ATPase ABCA3-like [Bacillus rossius redtenbacheri]|uniref:phospholipid-transporting ATPase ABCA3-like n=1 Tax=Bacillus rossius redtenbacheri TaxID=93214 RepID=UPI002FDD127C